MAEHDPESHGLLGEVFQTAMYFCGSFHANPAKPLVHKLWCNTGYEVAYKHFKRDHTKPLNLGLHAVALGAQVVTNFAVLHRLDELIGSPSFGWLSASTALLWSAILVPQKASPLKARALAVALIAAGYFLRKKIVEKSDWLLWASSVVEAINFKLYFRLTVPKGVRQSIFPFESSAVRYLAMRLAITAALASKFEKCSSLLSRNFTASILLPLLTWSSYKPFERQGYRKSLYGLLLNINNYHFLGWLLYFLTGEKLFFLHSAAFSSTGIQGIAHQISNEEGTLPQLNNSHYEYAHCTYFPVLVLHRVFEHLGNRALVAKLAAGRA